ncbi:MAG: heme lyase CcmF/NrfE family subunit [Rickettsiales bacterium]
MIAELGVFLLVLAFLTALLQSFYLLPFAPSRLVLGRILPMAAWLQALCVASALAILVILRLDSDFSVINVVAHSNLSLPTLYKITGTWGNHEGSMLLWVFVLALFGALLMTSCEKIKLYASAIQSLLCAGFLAFILYTSNPFARIFPPPVDGKTLNPLLQDIGLAIHPPLLYLGYVGFSIVFSLAVAALIQGRADRDWARLAHPWIMVSWSALTLGIGLGSWWAYRELGWGGWWFWDPVENASLLPWLSGTALFHSNIVLKKRGMMAQWVILLSIITFALSLLGTFLVRSGIITSVHSFASDPERGIFILAYILITVGGALFLYSLRGGKISSQGQMLPTSREGLIVINNLFILSACATVLLGTLYPIFIEISGGESITVGAPFFNATFIPLMALPLVFAALTPFMAWKKASLRASIRATQPAMLATLASVFIVLAFIDTKIISAICGFALATWLTVGSLQWLVGSRGRRGRYAVFLGHIGAAFIVIGITSSSLWKEEVQKQVIKGESLTIAGYTINYVGIKNATGKNYSSEIGQLKLEDKHGKILANLFPEYRKYSINGSQTSETDIYYGWLGDLYSVIGETSADGKTAIRLYFQPMISFIWLGFVLMALGGIISVLTSNRKNKAENLNVTL